MKVVLTCAITGGATKPEQTPYLPITPWQIAQSALECADAGAAAVHIHVRDPETGRPSMDLNLYEETFNIIKQRNNDLLINLTTGPGAVYVPSKGSLTVGSEKSKFFAAERRVAHIIKLKPDLCSLDFNTMHQAGNAVRINYIPVLQRMLDLIQEAGTKPELELFDSGDMRIAKELFVPKLKKPPLWQFAMGVKYGWLDDITTLDYALWCLGKDQTWSAFGLGKNEMTILEATYKRGGHVRVGMEDNIYLSRGVLAEKNHQLVSQAVQIIESLGGTVATPAEAREIYAI